MPSTPARSRFLQVWVILALAVLLASASTAGYAPLSPGIGYLFVPKLIGGPAQAQPIESFPVPQHPFMAANARNSMHNDAYATDAYTGAGPLGRDPQVTSAAYGIAECATLTFDRLGRLIGLCGDPLGPTMKIIDPVSLRVLQEKRLPGRKLRAGVSPLQDLCGGSYFYLDHNDRAVVATTDRQVHVITSSGLVTERVYGLADLVPTNDCLISLMPDWSGRIWFVTSAARVGYIEPVTGQARAMWFDGEIIANSFAVDETGGVYIVTDHALYRFEAAADGPRVTWRQGYDRGSRLKPGQLSHGSGTTPTLFGPGRVAITDNAEPRMNVLVYERSNGRLVCSEPVFAAGASATDNSLIAVGNSLIVENNYGYTGPTSTLFGGTSSPGISKVDVVGDSCMTAWTSQEIAPSCVPKVSLANGLLYVYTKPAGGRLASWYFTAIDVRTGRTVYSVLTGTGVQWNNHYAAVTLGPDGSAYIATLAGLVRIHDA